MIHKCSLLNVLEVFFKEPTGIHFIREIAKKIKLAPTSVRNNLQELEKEGIIRRKKAKPFDGYAANRENEMFLFYKKAYNFYTTNDIKNSILGLTEPKAIIVFGSYTRGEDIENSDIDILIISKIKKEVNLEDLEKRLERKINAIIVSALDRLDEHLRKNVSNGWIIYGGI